MCLRILHLHLVIMLNHIRRFSVQPVLIHFQGDQGLLEEEELI